jgi:hypothetical protein
LAWCSCAMESFVRFSPISVRMPSGTPQANPAPQLGSGCRLQPRRKTTRHRMRGRYRTTVGRRDRHASMSRALGEADLVQENAPERPDFKVKLFAEMDQAAHSGHRRVCRENAGLALRSNAGRMDGSLAFAGDERLLLPCAIAARLRFSDLYCTHTPIPWNQSTRV